MSRRIPFNKPYMTGRELEYIAQAHQNGSLAGDGPFTKKCHNWLQSSLSVPQALLTHSCTAALEMSALLMDVQPGDEIIMPSFTFVSTANAFVLRGGRPVFVDIRPDTLNIDEKLIESAITKKTKAIVVVHYAGVACEMDKILSLAQSYHLFVVEDSAQGLFSSYKGKPLGSLGDFAAVSFHETKNIISGEGGCLLVNNKDYVNRAEIIREKGTDRSRFFRGQVDKYSWQDIGSSFLPGELIAAFLWAQLEMAEQITSERLKAWNRYHEYLEPLERKGFLRRPIIPENCKQNGHIYYVMLESYECRQELIKRMKDKDVYSMFHYVPLHSSPAGIKYARAVGDMKITNTTSLCLLRLPIWVGITEQMQREVISFFEDFFLG